MTTTSHSGANYPHWDSHWSEICAHIKSHPTQVKIIVKVKDEDFQLKLFVEHHLSLIDFSKDAIIIADNGSSSLLTLQMLEQAANDGILVFRFDGHCDSIHIPSRMPMFYEALRQSCDYYIFLDADERMYPINADNKFLPMNRFLAGLDADRSSWVLTHWMLGCPGSLNYYKFLLPGLLAGGKPLLSNRLAIVELDRLVNHNSQLYPQLHTENVDYCGGIVLAHIPHLSASDRIEANFRKLISSQSIADRSEVYELSPDQIEAMPDGPAKTYIREIHIHLGRYSPAQTNAHFSRQADIYLDNISGRIVPRCSDTEIRLLTYRGDCETLVKAELEV